MTGTTPVAAYGATNFTTQTATAYKTQIDANSVVAKRGADNFAPHAQSTPNMTIALDAGHLFDGTTLTEVAAQNTGTIAAPVSHPRIDRVVIDNVTGVISVIAGTEAVSPAAPAMTRGKSPVAQIALQTTTTSITNAIITDERDFSATNIGGFGAQTGISSASTCDLGSITSHNVLITGMTTITSFGSSAATADPIYLIEFAAALTLTYNATSLILEGSANITTAAGDTALAEDLGSGNWRVRGYCRKSGQALVYTTPVCVGHAYKSTNTAAATSSPIPYDNTIPQSTEGGTVFGSALGYTPKAVGNKIVVTWGINLDSSASATITSLFKDSGTSAVAAAMVYGSASFSSFITGQHIETAADTSAHTWQVNYGAANSGNSYLNQSSGGTTLGGVFESYIEIREYTQ